MIKSIITNIIKFSFAFIIIYWMIKEGKLDFSIIKTSINYKLAWGTSFIIMFLNLFLTSYRWKLLLEIKSSKKLPITTITRLTWIGVFFSTVLPGIVTGDIVKLVYAKDLDKDLSKTYLLTSALMDRIIGLIGLLFILGVFSIIFYNTLVAKGENVANLIHINFLIFAGIIVFISTLFLPQKIQNAFHHLVEKVPVIGKIISNVFKQTWLIGKSPITLLSCLSLSTLIQTTNIFAFWYLAKPFIKGIDLSLEHAFTFIPLGFITTALPISPAGVGVGHAAFDQLFALFGVTNGASLFNLYLICWISVNLLGSVAYLISKTKYSINDAANFESSVSKS